MNLARFLAEERVDLALERHFDDEHPVTHEGLVERMVDLLETSDDVVNATKLRNDLVLRERRAPSLPGCGVALPHVRTLQARRTIMAVGVSGRGLALQAPDELPVRLAIAFVAPPYDDRSYHAVYRLLGERLQSPDWVERIVGAESRGVVLRLLAGP